MEQRNIDLAYLPPPAQCNLPSFKLNSSTMKVVEDWCSYSPGALIIRPAKSISICFSAQVPFDRLKQSAQCTLEPDVSSLLLLLSLTFTCYDFCCCIFSFRSSVTLEARFRFSYGVQHQINRIINLYCIRDNETKTISQYCGMLLLTAFLTCSDSFQMLFFFIFMIIFVCLGKVFL